MDYNELQLKAVTDLEFRAALVADPKAVLTAAGAQVPENVSVRILESTPEEIVLSSPPFVEEEFELDEDALAETAAGSTPLCAVWTGYIVGSVIVAGTGSFVAGHTAGEMIRKASK